MLERLATCVLISLCTSVKSDDGATTIKPHPDAVANSHVPGEVDHPELVPFIVQEIEELQGIVLDETDAVLNTIET